MQKETLDKLRRYIDMAATHSSLSVTFPMGRWPEHEVERARAWQKFVEAVQGDAYALGTLLNSLHERMEILEGSE